MRATVGIVTSRAPGSRHMCGRLKTRTTPTASPGRSSPGQAATTPPRACAAFKGEVLDHVLPGHSQPEPEERDLLKLQAQKGKVVRQDLSLYFCALFHSGTEDLPLF